MARRGDIYAESLPVRVAGVLCGEIREGCEIAFSQNGEEYSFLLPEEELYNRCIEFEGSFSRLSVQLGGVKHTLTAKPFILPLFNFLSGGCGKAWVPSGTIEAIKLS